MAKDPVKKKQRAETNQLKSAIKKIEKNEEKARNNVKTKKQIYTRRRHYAKKRHKNNYSMFIVFFIAIIALIYLLSVSGWDLYKSGNYGIAIYLVAFIVVIIFVIIGAIVLSAKAYS